MNSIISISLMKDLTHYIFLLIKEINMFGLKIVREKT